MGMLDKVRSQYGQQQTPPPAGQNTQQQNSTPAATVSTSATTPAGTQAQSTPTTAGTKTQPAWRTRYNERKAARKAKNDAKVQEQVKQHETIVQENKDRATQFLQNQLDKHPVKQYTPIAHNYTNPDIPDLTPEERQRIDNVNAHLNGVPISENGTMNVAGKQVNVTSGGFNQKPYIDTAHYQTRDPKTGQVTETNLSTPITAERAQPTPAQVKTVMNNALDAQKQADEDRRAERKAKTDKALNIVGTMLGYLGNFAGTAAGGYPQGSINYDAAETARKNANAELLDKLGTNEQARALAYRKQMLDEAKLNASLGDKDADRDLKREMYYGTRDYNMWKDQGDWQNDLQVADIRGSHSERAAAAGVNGKIAVARINNEADEAKEKAKDTFSVSAGGQTFDLSSAQIDAIAGALDPYLRGTGGAIYKTATADKKRKLAMQYLGQIFTADEMQEIVNGGDIKTITRTAGDRYMNSSK